MKIKAHFAQSAIAGILVLSSWSMLYPQSVATISATNQQTVKGWGCCPLWIDNFDISTQPLTQEAAYGMGATIIRHSQIAPLGDAGGNISQSDADRLCRSIQITTSRGLPYIISNWSPPACMKTIAVNGSVSGTTSVYLKTDKEQAFCDFVVAMFNYISKTKGLPLPVAYSLQNEPTCGTPWQGCIYDSDQYKRVAKLLRTTLNAAGYSGILLLGPEDGGYFNGQGWNWSVGLLGGAGFPSLNDTAFNRAMGGLASHSYDWSPNTPLANYNAWVSGCDTWGKDRWQTELCYIEDTVNPHAVGTARRLIGDMAFLKNNYWFTWTVCAGNDNDVPDALCFGDGVNRTTRKPAYYVLKKLFTSIPIGAKVRRMTSTDNGLVTTNAGRMDMVAFASDTNMVAVIVNPTTTSKVTNINGLIGTTARIYQIAGTATNTDMALIASPAVSGGSLTNIGLPVNSITIIVARGVVTEREIGRAGALSGIRIVTLENSIIIHGMGPVMVTLTSVSGQRVLSENADAANTCRLSLKGIGNGVYFLAVKSREEKMIRKIAVRH